MKCERMPIQEVTTPRMKQLTASEGEQPRKQEGTSAQPSEKRALGTDKTAYTSHLLTNASRDPYDLVWF